MTRETAERIVRDNYAMTGIRRGDGELVAAIEAALVSARADGERDGLEKAAKVADDYREKPLYAPEMAGKHPRDSARRDISAEIAVSIRALKDGT